MPGDLRRAEGRAWSSTKDKPPQGSTATRGGPAHRGGKKSLQRGDMLTRRRSLPGLDLNHAIQTRNEPPETIMNARIGQLFDAILTTTMGLASMSAVVAIVMGA